MRGTLGDRLILEPIGTIHSAHNEPQQTPIQPVCAEGSAGLVEVFPQFAEGLDDIEGYSHLHLIYWLHRATDIAGAVAGPSPLKVVPFLDDVARGVFATRTPVRPNPLGLSVVRLVERRGNELLVEDLDVLDGTPLLDIKPYVEGFDLRVGTRGGWTEQVSRETFLQRGQRRTDAR
jgi:tRNA-Thr(GGU) m(6)t(6)A37 methyltransferase TsaA